MEIREEKGPDEKRGMGDFAKFLLTLTAAAVVIIVLGLYFIHRLFLLSPTPGKLDFSGALSQEVLSPEAPVSPHAARAFFTTDGRRLSAETMPLPRELSSYERISRLMDRLVRGPMSKYFEPLLPEGTNLMGIFIVDDQVTLNFSRQLQENFRGGVLPELLTVYSIVNTVTLNVEGASTVQILIDGEVKSSLGGGIDIEKPLGTNLNLVQW